MTPEMPQGSAKFYPPAEEKFNIISHALGMLLSVFGLVMLLFTAADSNHWSYWVALPVFGFSLLALYTSSTCYHLAQEPTRRKRLRVVDHAMIYVLIAGTYTPFMLIVMPGVLGYSILALAWGMALLGICLKLFFTGRFELVSTFLYVLMGWAIVFAFKPLAENMAAEGLYWLIAGGLSYTAGAIIYAIKKVPFNHAIFHVFVLLGSASHFISVYRYL